MTIIRAVVLITHLVSIDTIVNRPRCLEILKHALLQLLWQPMDTYEVLQILHARVIQRAA